MATQIIPYSINPTKLIPNSPKPLLLYKNCFMRDGKPDATLAFNTFRNNGWDAQWVTTYGHHQRSHYHPTTPEVMVVLSGPGTIRWGTADLSDDPHEHTYGSASEEGAFFTDVEAGDVFVIPAGVAHKSYDRGSPSPDVTCLTGRDAHGIEAEDPGAFVGELKVSGFTMMGAYPRGVEWSWSEGGADDAAGYESVWRVKNPDLDPVLGTQGGIHTYWNVRGSAL